jgi:BirA family biotin operon repressor/biotin-[acetyl-CoA-carboxylase] ligase
MYSILQILEDKLQLLDQNDHASLKMSYESNLFRKGVPSNFMTSDKRKFKGSIEGVSDEGKLKIKPTKGDIQLFDFKEITLLN